MWSRRRNSFWNWLLGFDHPRVAPIIENRFQTAGSRGCYSCRHTEGISTSQRAFPTARRTLPSFRRQRRNELNPPEILTKQQLGRHHHKSLGGNISEDVGPRPALTQLCSQAPRSSSERDPPVLEQMLSSLARGPNASRCVPTTPLLLGQCLVSFGLPGDSWSVTGSKSCVVDNISIAQRAALETDPKGAAGDEGVAEESQRALRGVSGRSCFSTAHQGQTPCLGSLLQSLIKSFRL